MKASTKFLKEYLGFLEMCGNIKITAGSSCEGAMCSYESIHLHTLMTTVSR
jgi:hypothetical protein